MSITDGQHLAPSGDMTFELVEKNKRNWFSSQVRNEHLDVGWDRCFEHCYDIRVIGNMYVVRALDQEIASNNKALNTLRDRT